MTFDPSSLADLEATLSRMSDTERHQLEARVLRIAQTFAQTGMPHFAAVFRAFAVVIAEEADRGPTPPR